MLNKSFLGLKEVLEIKELGVLKANWRLLNSIGKTIVFNFSDSLISLTPAIKKRYAA